MRPWFPQHGGSRRVRSKYSPSNRLPEKPDHPFTGIRLRWQAADGTLHRKRREAKIAGNDTPRLVLA